LSEIYSQFDSRFRPFDWTLYRAAGAITSITEGYTFAYIGTELGGVKRFNLFGNYFDDPITTAQGLKNNNITAIHFDAQTGLIWVATPDYIQYSFSREGDWFSSRLNTIGLSNSDRIIGIGSSNNYIWLQARSSFVKLDHSSGTLIGIFPLPDEISIDWSSAPYNSQDNLKNIFLNYNILEGWIFNGGALIDRMGRKSSISAGVLGRHGNVYAGTDEGTMFFGTTTMETLTPIMPDIVNSDVTDIYDDGEYFWIGSKDYITSKGISRIDPQSKTSQVYLFEETINMQPSSIYSLYFFDSELWAGGDDIILYFDSKENYWRTLSGTRDIPNGMIWDLCADDTHLWMASSQGLRRIERSTKSEDPIGIESFFDQVPVYDIEFIENQMWIGAKSGLFIYSNDNPQLVQASNYGRKNFHERFYDITVIENFDRVTYVAGDMGIAKFDFDKNEWDLIFSSVVYQNKKIYSLAINDKFLFLGTEIGLVRINRKTGLIKDYLFSFIGQVNDIILKGNLIWLGTETGLIKFKWKKDL